MPSRRREGAGPKIFSRRGRRCRGKTSCNAGSLPALAQTSPVSGKSPLDGRLDCRGSSRLPDRKFPRLDRMQGPPLGGLLLFWVIGSQRLTTASQLAGIALAIQYACSRAAESLVIRFPKFLTVRGLPANQPGPKDCHRNGEGFSLPATGAGPSSCNMP